ncbi:MAG: hypothetical protein ACI97A_003945 [Planctomycetota bacterium]|jgi:hypothetical protein
MKTIKLFLFLFIIVVTVPGALAQYKGAVAVPPIMAPGFNSIDEGDCKKWLTYLSSDELGGRKTGSDGYIKAAKFIAGKFKEFGLKPIGANDTYFQEVTLYRMQRSGQAASVVIGDKSWDESTGLQPRLSLGDAKASVVFICSGSKKKKLKDPSIVKDKIVILNASRNARLSPLFRQIRENRPKGIILRGQTSSPLGFVRPGGLTQKWVAAVPQIGTSDSVFADILKTLKIKGNFAGKPQKNAFKVIELQTEIAVHSEVEHTTVKAPNVIGMIDGSDEKLKSEVVICGSHLDHIGTSRNGKINNGADDDGSGTTSLLAVARAIAKNTTKPKRSIVFIAVCGEEDGLLGSEYYVENPIIPIKDTICELQMDMVGRNEEGKGDRPEKNIKTTHLVGSKKLSMDLHKMIIKMNRHIGFEFEYDEEAVYTRSDHYNFAKKGIPIAFFFSGFHPDYHRPTDTVEKINFVKLANTAKLVYLTAYTAADRSKRIVKDKKKKKKQ